MLNLQKIRKEKNIKQEEVAKLLGITRQTYSHIEKWNTDLTLWQAVKVGEFFSIDITDFFWDTKIITKNKEFNRDKYKQIIKQFISKASDYDWKITKTKLAKLCYLLDFVWYYYNLESITGLEYRKIQQWPVPDLYFTTVEELQEQEEIAIEQKWKAFMISNISFAKSDLLLDDELNRIDNISTKRKDKNTKEIVDFTHNQMPWMICSDKEIISYDFITQEDSDNVY